MLAVLVITTVYCFAVVAATAPGWRQDKVSLETTTRAKVLHTYALW